MKLNVVLVEPEIPQNTGNIARTCAATGGKLHLVHPLGFKIDDKSIKRAGLDYWDKLEIEEHNSLDEFLEKYRPEENNMFFATTKGKTKYTDIDYLPNERVTNTTKEIGAINAADSSISIVLTKYKVYSEEMLEKQAAARKKQMEASLKAGNLSEADKRKNNRIIRFMQEAKKELYLDDKTDGTDTFAKVKAKFERELAEMKTETMKIKARLENLFSFVEEAFAEGNEMLILVTELTVNHNSARFISRFGCDSYQKHNENLMLTERQSLLKEEIEALNL